MRSQSGVLALIVALAAPVAGQRGVVPTPSPNVIGSRSCLLPQPACPYDTELLPSTQKLESNVNQIVWTPIENYDPDKYRKRVTPAGQYTFRFVASNKCVQKEATATVNIRCPPKPTADVTMVKDKNGHHSVLYGQKATFNASASRAFDPSNRLYYEWWVVNVPRDSDIKITNTPIPGANSDVYTTPALSVGGAYQYKVIVSDGCSTSEFPVCFTVECNCAPTANAGATSTVWTNTPTVFNNAATSSGTNNANGRSWTLDGSLSFDFDLTDQLTYTWDFVSWRSLDPALDWDRTTNTQSTRTNYGYLTNCKDSGGGGNDQIQQCTFTRLGRLGQDDRQDTAQETFLDKNETTPRSSAIGYPRRVPHYNESSEIARPGTKAVGSGVYQGYGTWYQANISKVSYVNTITRRIEYNSSSCVTSGEANMEYCSITIRQTPATNAFSGGASMSRWNPRAGLSLSPSIKKCRGLWRFKLTVKDICGTVTESTDTITVTVRCNEPPVAVACCNNTQVWQGSNFEQVRLDGRASNDGDFVNQDKRPGYRGVVVESLTYTWTFTSQPEGHCPQGGHRPCVEAYCNNQNYFTNENNGLMEFSGVNNDCSPTVYPTVFDINSPLGNIPGCNNPRNNPGGGNVCRYKPVVPTQYHVGNSAYFTPSIRGNYVVKLEVYDGCNTATDSIVITAVCPTLISQLTLETNSGVKNGGSQATVKVFGKVLAYAGNAAQLTYQWSAVNTATKLTAGQWTNGGDVNATVGFDSSGTFTISFGVSDKCQTTTVTRDFIVRCNSAPSSPVLAVTQPANTALGATVYYAGNSFPSITIEAKATDSDPLTYSFATVTGNAATVTTSNPNSNSVQFTPVSLINLGSYTFDTTTAMGRYTVNNAQYTVSATASDGCTSSTRSSTTIRVACQGVLQANPGLVGGQNVNYDHTLKAFPLVKLDGSASSFQNAGTQRIYQWAVAYTSNAPNSVPSRVADSAGSGWNDATGILTFRPSAVGAYRASLTVSDGCAFNSRSVLIQATCAIGATARARVLVGGAPLAAGTVVSWNSYLTSQTAGFPTITLDATQSTGAANDQLFYSWSYSGTTANRGLSTTTQSLVSYTLSGEGTHTIQLSVRNGVCPSDTTTVTVTSRCMVISALLRNAPGVSVGKSAQINVDFDGTKFPRAVLDGLATTYTDPRDSSIGNFERLSYKWNIIKSPLNSMYEAYILQNTIATAPASTILDPVQLEKNETQLTGGIKRTCVKNRMTQLISASTMYYQTEVLLSNKHYNRPHTCFIPDVPGTYEVKLTVMDGCASSEATATVIARCAEPPVVSNVNFKQVLYTLNTSTVTRVVMPALVTSGRNAVASSLTYQWSVVSAPGSSMHKPNVSCTITNDKANTASVVVDVAGSYIFTVSVFDGCNAPVNMTFSFSAACNEDITLQAVSVAPAGANWTSLSTPLSFTLKSGASSFCGTPTFNWVLQSRTCNTPYTAPRPPAVSSTCPALPYTCNWKIVDQPCTLKTVNPRYLAPILEPNATDKTNCRTKFICRHSGTYTLRLTVQDGCGLSNDDMTVTCRCATNIQAVLTLPGRSMFECDAPTKRYMYNQVSLNATARLGQPGPNNAIHPCPLKATPATCTDALKKKCCTAPKCCGDANMHQCPQCPMCPMCPACFPKRSIPCTRKRVSSSGLRTEQYTEKCVQADGQEVDYAQRGTGAGAAPAMQRQSSLSSAFAATDASTESSVSWMMLSLTPIGALIVLSIVTNLWMMSSISTKSQQQTGSAMDVF